MKKGVEKDVDAVLISLQRVFTVLICFWLENWDSWILLASMLCLKEEQWRKEIFWYFFLFVRIDFFFWKRKKPSLLLLKRICAVGFLFSLQRIFFLWKLSFSPKKKFFFSKRSPLQTWENVAFIGTPPKTLILSLQYPKLSTG